VLLRCSFDCRITLQHECSCYSCKGAVGELHSAIGLSLLQARWSGTHYRLSFAICLSVLAFFGALLRRYYSRDVIASSTIEGYASIVLLCYINFRYLSIYLKTICSIKRGRYYEHCVQLFIKFLPVYFADCWFDCLCRADCDFVDNVVNEFDWTFTTDYCGSLVGHNDSVLQVCHVHPAGINKAREHLTCLQHLAVTRAALYL